MARVDSLPNGAKELLQAGSAIEREFSYELIKKVTGFPEKELISDLSALKDAELLYERGIYPQSTYIFKHALTREVVYDSILSKKRKQLHDKIGNAIEELPRGDIGDYYGLLAVHFLSSEHHEKAAHYSSLAAKKARKSGAFDDAITYGKRRIVCLEKLSRIENVQREIIEARTTLGMFYNQTQDFVSSKEIVEPIVEMAFQHANKKRIAQIYTIIGTYIWAVEENFPKAKERLEEAVKFARDSNDLVSLVMANHFLGHMHSDDCEFDKALYHLEKGLEITSAANVTWAIAAHKGCIARTVHYFQGNIERSHQASLEAVKLAEKSGDIYSKGEAYVSLGCSYFGKGFLDEAERHLLKGSDLCGRLNLILLEAFGRFCLGEVYFQGEKYEESMDQYSKAISILEVSGILSSLRDLSKIGVARAEVMNNEKDIDLESLYGYVHQNKMRLLGGSMRRYISEILLNLDELHMDAAEDWIKKAIETDKGNNLRGWHLAWDYVLYAEVLKRKGDLLKAKENLNTALETYKMCGADGWVNKAEGELAAFS
jgi:tetratricopeptide (TPR) repeat protein